MKVLIQASFQPVFQASSSCAAQSVLSAAAALLSCLNTGGALEIGNLGQTQSPKRVGFVWFFVCLFIFCLTPHGLFLTSAASLSEAGGRQQKALGAV